MSVCNASDPRCPPKLKGSNSADSEDVASPALPFEHTRAKRGKGGQSSLPRGGHGGNAPPVTEPHCMTKNMGHQSSLSRGGHWEGSPFTNDKGPTPPSDFEGKRPHVEGWESSALPHSWWTLGRSCNSASLRGFQTITRKDGFLRYTPAQWGQAEMGHNFFFCAKRSYQWSQSPYSFCATAFVRLDVSFYFLTLFVARLRYPRCRFRQERRFP